MTTTNYKPRITILISWAAVLLWMVLIFIFSGQVADQSNQLSHGVTEIVIEAVEKVVPKAELDLHQLNHIVRKNAHFFTYLVLGLLVMHAIRRSGVMRMKGVLFAFLLCVLYAISDETHQLFVPGRGAKVKDVLIDSSGSLVGIGIFYAIDRIRHKRRNVPR